MLTHFFLSSSKGQLKIADLGLSRVFNRKEDRSRLYSHQVATRWYRAPELLYGARKYSEAVDLWSVGCIFGELLNFAPIFPGENDIDQLGVVIRVLGTPNDRIWPGVSGNDDAGGFLKYFSSLLPTHFRKYIHFQLTSSGKNVCKKQNSRVENLMCSLNCFLGMMKQARKYGLFMIKLKKNKLKKLN